MQRFLDLVMRCSVFLALWLPATLAQTKYVQCPGVNLDPVIPKGKRFFHSVTGEYFPVKGIAYYPRPNNGTLSVSNSVDFFTNDFRDLWEADVESFKTLGVNTIRLYAVDPSQNHDAFMCALQEAGIYVMVGLLADCEDCGIGPDEAPSCYPPSLKERGQWIMNEFSKYTNTLAFSAGNEVTLYATDQRIELNAPCQKKFLRDMRAYVDKCSAIPASILPRKIPIGMVNWDKDRELQTLYFNCRTDSNDELENAEWYGLNSYQHCSPSATSVDQLLGWQTLRGDFASYDLSIPIVISEYGCRERFPTIGEFEAQRTWLQVDALYSPSYMTQFAGGIVFEFSAEKLIVDESDQGNPWPYNQFMKLNYGIGYYSPVDCDHQTKPCEYNPYPEFDLLSSKMAAVDTSSMPDIDTYIPTGGSIPTCPVGLAPLSDFVWSVDEEPDLPCYVLPTNAPTTQPSLSPSPSSEPSASPIGPPTLNPTAMPSPSGTPAPTSDQPVAGTTIAPSPVPSPLSSTTSTTNKPTTVFGNIDAPAAFLRTPAPALPPVDPTPSPVGQTNSPTSSSSSALAMAAEALISVVLLGLVLV